MLSASQTTVMNKPIVIHLSQSDLHFTHFWLYNAYTELFRWLWWLSALLLLLDPVLCWSFVWPQSEADQDTDLAEKMTWGGKLLSLLAQMSLQTTALKKWRKYHNSSIRARDCFQAASIIRLCFLIPIFLDLTLKSPPRLRCLSWVCVAFSSPPSLLFLSCLTNKHSPLGLSSSPYSFFRQCT